MCNCLQGSPSEAVSFTTLNCEPEPPNPPRKASGNKNTLVLQWKVKTEDRLMELGFKTEGWGNRSNITEINTSNALVSLVYSDHTRVLHLILFCLIVV